MKPRVVITGIGALTPIGNGVEGLWNGILREKSGIRFLTRFDTAAYQAKCAGELDGFCVDDYLPKHKSKRLDRYAQFSVITAAQALQDAGLALDSDHPRSEIGCSWGTALGGIAGAEENHQAFVHQGIDAIPAPLALQVFGGAAHSNIAIAFGLRGYGTTNSNSCASGTVAVGEAFRAIREGYATTMIAGASEAPLSPLTFGAFDILKTMSREAIDPSLACRPFDRYRNGFVMAEGAAALILEERNQALQRGARIYAEVLGYSLNNDAYHMTASLPNGEAAIAAMHAALNEAQLRPDQIDYLNAHASSTPMNDGHEAGAILKVFGASGPSVSGTKGYTGHPLGATGAIEAAITALALHHQRIPPTVGCTEPEIPEGLRLVMETGLNQPFRTAMSNSFGFGGINSVIVLKTAE